ncbi:hypothetical protein FHT87_006198, partial [Rhizobium sp. BK316]|nr:hypothetical protein [Rhizobium sp. BK316]
DVPLVEAASRYFQEEPARRMPILANEQKAIVGDRGNQARMALTLPQ